MPVPVRPRARSLMLVASVALAAGCREQVPSTTDSSLARDLAMAQRALPPQAIFNDAPVGATAPAAPARPARTTRPEPPRVRESHPAPTPQPRRAPAPMAPSPRQPAPAAAAEVPAPRPAPDRGVIGAGSQIGMTTNERVCTASTLVGDKFTAKVAGATIGTDGAMIPAGATVVLEVVAVDRADPADASRIAFRVRSIDVGGVAEAAEGEVATLSPLQAVQSAGGGDRSRVVGGAVAGAVLGRVLGGSTKATIIGAAAGAAAGTATRGSRRSDACLPEGSALRLTLSRQMVVRRSSAI